MYYAIETIGYGKRRVYVLKQVTDGGRWIVGVDGVRYRTEQAARDAADKLGIKVGKVGNLYQII